MDNYKVEIVDTSKENQSMTFISDAKNYVEKQ